MKMPEKHDLLAAILAARNKASKPILAFAMAAFMAADIMAVHVYKRNSNRRNDVRHYA